MRRFLPMLLRRRPQRLAGLAAMLLAVSSGIAAAEPPKPDQLVVRGFVGTWGEAFKATVAKMFTEKYGIPIVLDPRLDPTISILVETAIRQHRQPPIDVSLSLENQTYQEAARGITEDLSPAEIPNIAQLLPNARPEGNVKGWPYVNFAVDILTLVYRKSAFPAGPPDTLNVLFEPRLKGRIVASQTALSSIMLVSLAKGWKIPEDMDKIWKFIADGLKPQHPILGNDPAVVNGFERNEIDAAFTFPANAAGLEQFGIGWTVTKEGMLGLNEGYWIPRGLPESNDYWAKKFIDFALSHDALQAYCDKLYIPCFRKDVTPPPGAAKDAYFPKTPADFARIHTTPFDVYAAHQLDWDARYDSIMK